MKIFILLSIFSFNVFAWNECKGPDGSMSFGDNACLVDPNKGVYITGNIERNVGNIIVRRKLVERHKQNKRIQLEQDNAPKVVGRTRTRTVSSRGNGKQTVMEKAQSKGKRRIASQIVAGVKTKKVKKAPPQITVKQIIGNQWTIKYKDGQVRTCKAALSNRDIKVVDGVVVSDCDY